MLTPEQIQRAREQLGVKSGITTSPAESIARRQLLWSEYDKQNPPSFGQKVGEAFGRAGERLGQAFTKTASGQIHPLQGSVKTTGAVGGLVGDVIMEGLKSANRFLGGVPGEAIKGELGAMGQVASLVPGVQEGTEEAVSKVSEWAKANPEQAATLQDILDTLNLLPPTVGAKGVQVGAEALGRGVVQGAGAVGKVIPKVMEGGAEIVARPKPTPLGAVGQVLQGKQKDIKQGVQSLANLDLEGVSTFKDLGTKISSKITELAKQVDVDLAVDTTKRKLNELVTTAKTIGGKVVKDSPVRTALEHLAEVYKKVGDRVGVANMKELLQRARNEGLTNVEVNQLARDYGVEFGKKAFGKTGEALTSVNARLYENTREALKNLARGGIKGEEARLADQTMSALYSTQKLVQKNVDAVNKLKQKIQEAGLLEKVGHAVTKYADILTGGSIRGLIGGLLPRGAGYKVMNALDLEDLLKSNLQIIQDAVKSKSDSELMKILDKLNLKGNPAMGKIALAQDIAKQNEPILVNKLKALFPDSKVSSRVKGMAEKSPPVSLIKKIDKHGGNIDEIYDVLGTRVTVVESKVGATLDKLEKNFNIVDKQDFEKYTRKGEWPYDGVNLKVKLDNGSKVEIQVHTPESAKIADKMHGFYKKWQYEDIENLTPQRLAEYNADRANAFNFAGKTKIKVSKNELNNLVKVIEENKGITYDMLKHQLVGREGYSVSLFPERSKTFGKLNSDNVADFISENKDLLAQEGNKLGVWYDTESGKYYLDVSYVEKNLDRARELGSKYNQKSIWNMKNFKEIDTGGTGENVGQFGDIYKRIY